MDTLGIDHHFHPQHQHHNHGHFATQQLPSRSLRKRKADAPPENNERLSKRLSLLNLEHSGQKLYVPVESSTSTSQTWEPLKHKHSSSTTSTTTADASPMQLDDSKHKVYIYNLDDELSSSDSESVNGDGRLVFLPDIEKHLRSSRVGGGIPAPLLEHRGTDLAELAGKELVLYRVPSSLTVPEEQDSVRRAIIEARARARERQKQRLEGEGGDSSLTSSAAGSDAVPVMATVPSPAPAPVTDVVMDAEGSAGSEDDPDAMELD